MIPESGFYPATEPVIKYNIVAQTDSDALAAERSAIRAFTTFRNGMGFAMGEYIVAANGADNLLPNECVNMIRLNPVLGRILKKQAGIMYGRGLGLYTSKDEEANTRIWVNEQHADVKAWLNSWERMGIPSLRTYLTGVITDYYYHEMYYSGWEMTRGARLGMRKPVAGLVHHAADRMRLATDNTIDIYDTLEDFMLTKVLKNRWEMPYRYHLLEYDRFSPQNPTASANAISVVRDLGAGEDIYSIPTAYYGLRTWIKTMNLNPQRVESFLTNSFSARKHVEIPQAWISGKKTQLEKICQQNKELKAANKPIVDMFEGVELGTVYSETLLQKVIDKKMASLVDVMSGAGENQGKTFFTTTFLTQHGIEKWTITDIPTNFKDFTDSIIAVDKHALRDILAGIGVPPEISNVGNEGVFSSGSQLYYAYLVYLDTLHFSESVILEDLNRALYINFPDLERAGVRFGFMRFNPPKQQETAPADRINNNVN